MKKSLLVDGNNLLKIGFHGVKDYYYKGNHIGGIWHFLNTLRRFIETYNFDKIVVFWDAESNTSERKKIYPDYKNGTKEDNELSELSFNYQKNRIKLYLEEMFIRQIEHPNNEADDLIAYYCHISKDEDKIIFSADKDLTQLISDKVSVYSPSTKDLYKLGDKIKFYTCNIPHYNVKTLKILTGDKSDNINGIYYLGEKTLIKYFPEILDNEVKISDILTKAEELLKEDKDNNTFKNLLTGRTKTGIYGEEFFQINEKIIDLMNPLITDDAKKIVDEYYLESLDPEDRGYKNIIKLMMADGIFKYLPKRDDAWVYFLTPFLKIIRKEKKNYNKQK